LVATLPTLSLSSPLIVIDFILIFLINDHNWVFPAVGRQR
jgi:hypothetical protein